MRRELYPANWEAISTEVRARSGGRCECAGECGLHRKRRCTEQHGQNGRWMRGRVILTVHHLNFKKHDSRRVNLKAMCQRCHLRCDAPLRAERQKQRQDAATGQMRIPGMRPLEVHP